MAESIHTHCELCYCVNKCKEISSPPYSCDIISCGLDCGARFHACKANEHVKLCPREKVPCINEGNGCDMVLQRCHQGSHLQRCPASVIYCTMEWNRWPVFSQERQKRVPFSPEKVHARYGQLDVALALRDQRMLNKAMNVPRSTRRALRSSLTRRFPAVPIMHKERSLDAPLSPQDSTSTSCTVSDDDSDTPWQQRKNPPGLQASVCNELFSATKKATESLTAALNLINNPTEKPVSCHSNSSTNEKCDLVNSKDSHQSENYKSAISFSGDSRSSLSPSGDYIDIKCVCCAKKAMLNKNKVYNAADQGCKTENVDFDCESLSPTATCDISAKKKTLGTQLNCDVCDNLGATENLHPDGVTRSKSTCEGSELMLDHMDLGIASVVTNPNRNIPQPPNIEPNLILQEILGLDLNMEQITRYQAKPNSMYTFLCAQFFRRDEYPWHFKNLHGDIHAGMNGWMEQRCPLAYAGCTFSQRRLYPTERGAELVYSTTLESFGMKPYIPKALLNTRESMEREYLEYLRVTKGTKEATPEIFTSKDFDAYIKVHGKLQPHTKDTTVKPSHNVQHINPEKPSNQAITSSNNHDASPIENGHQSSESNPFCNNDKDSNVKECNYEDDCGCNECGRASSPELRPDPLTTLPFEILQHITRFLDGFSMNNLSLTCRTLRDVCCSLLNEKGVVVQEWERSHVGGKVHWYIGYQRWLFSTCFDPIETWGFVENQHISEHIKTCPFYHREPDSGTVFRMPGLFDMSHGSEFKNIMHRMYPEDKEFLTQES